PLLLAHCESRLHFAAHHVAGADVLEAGSGSGIGARLFRAAGAARVVGLDYNAAALAEARAATRDDRIECKRCGLNRSPVPVDDGGFDVVVCLEVLEHVREQAALVQELYRALKPGGRLLLSIPERGHEEAWAILNGYRNTYHVAVPDRQGLAAMLG